VCSKIILSFYGKFQTFLRKFSNINFSNYFLCLLILHLKKSISPFFCLVFYRFSPLGIGDFGEHFVGAEPLPGVLGAQNLCIPLQGSGVASENENLT
jgi:hypothetical protein